MPSTRKNNFLKSQLPTVTGHCSPRYLNHWEHQQSQKLHTRSINDNLTSLPRLLLVFLLFPWMLLVKRQDNSSKRHAYSQGIRACRECHASKNVALSLSAHQPLSFFKERCQSAPCIVRLLHWSTHSTCMQLIHPSESSCKTHLLQYHMHWLLEPLRASHQPQWSPAHSNQSHVSWKRDAAEQWILLSHTRLLCSSKKLLKLQTVDMDVGSPSTQLLLLMCNHSYNAGIWLAYHDIVIAQVFVQHAHCSNDICHNLCIGLCIIIIAPVCI